MPISLGHTSITFRHLTTADLLASLVTLVWTIHHTFTTIPAGIEVAKTPRRRLEDVVVSPNAGRPHMTS